MKKTILSIAVIAAAFVAASCQKENLQENNASEGSASLFTATIESGASTKTTVERVDGTEVIYKTKWDNGDEISINGTIFTATPASDATKATFTKKNAGDTDPTATFEAYFPEDLCKKMKGMIKSLPATYTYADGKYNMPMYAQSTTTSLSFKNLCGVLAITVKGTDFTSVNSIEVSSDRQMNGLFTAAADGTFTFDTEGVTLTDAHKKVALNFEPAKTIESTGSATFYIPVPPATNHTLTIKVTGGSTTKIMVTKKSGGVEVVRKTVYPITFADNAPAATTGTAKATIGGSEVDVNRVQLWENGPKFAEYNVGVTDGKAESYGGYYTWGGTYNNDPNLPGFSWTDDHNTSNTGSGNLSGADDTATNLWGSNWRMPTDAELRALFSNCDEEWTTVGGKNGCKFTGKTEHYTSNSAFLPAAGRIEGSGDGQGTYGRYWSSTPYGNNAFSLYFDSGNHSVSNVIRSRGYSVRAVLAE